MALSTADYLQQLQALLPQGPAWSRAIDAVITKLLEGFAEEYARIDNRADQLMEEVDPRTTFELLPDWERVAGLPDICTGPLEGLQARRAALVTKLTTIGGQSRAYYIAVAASLGYEISITEENLHDCLSDCMAPVGDEPWNYVWNVNVAQANTTRYLDCIDECITPLATWNDTLLECAISRLKPAHTYVRFNYL